MKDISVIFPVYNESETIETVLKEWKDMLDKSDIAYDLVVCEDGSKDGTTELLQQIQHNYNLVLNQKKTRRGYGGAVIDGIQESNSHYCLCVDSDGQCDPNDFMAFWEKKENADVLIGWRQERADTVQRKLFSGCFKLFFTLLFGSSVHDPSAPYVLFKKRNILPLIPYLRFLREGFWWGFIAACKKKNLTLSELPMHHRKRLKGDTQVYKPKEIPRIAFTNILGLIKLRMWT